MVIATGETRNCAHCGKPFVIRPRGWQALFCHPEGSQKRSLCATRAREAKRHATHNAYCRERHAIRMAVPGARERFNAKKREQDARRMQNAENREKRREVDRRRWAALKADPVRYARRLAAMRRFVSTRVATDKVKPAKVAARPLAGSVLAASSPRSEGRGILDALFALVPRRYEHDTRSEIISAAAVLVIEGASYSDAVETARRQVLRDASRLRDAKPIEACFWL